MTPEAQQIAIAEACGWESYTRTKQQWKNEAKGICGFLVEFEKLPDYLNNLNAMHEAEKSLTHDQWRILVGFLNKTRVIPRLMSMEEFHECWNATAAQRAEAFLRTIGKWVE